MTEDEEFDLLELRLRQQKERSMYPPLQFEEAIKERRLSIEHEVKTANANQVAGEHYMQMDIEPWDVIDTWPLELRVGFYRGNALKYIMRCGTKDERLQEIKNAAHYIEKLIEVLEKKP